MNSKSPFKWRHFLPEIILWGVRWYCLYPISYRQLEEMMCERGVEVDHSTLSRWVQKYAPELDKRCRPHLKPTNDSWRVDETYIKVKGKWKYLYRAVDSSGSTIDFMLSAKRDKRAAKRFLRKALKATHTQLPRVINVDKNAAYPTTIDELKTEELVTKTCEVRQNKYLNNIVEQDHRFIKKLVNSGLGFKSFYTARRTIIGYETMNMIRKGQIQQVEKGDVLGQLEFLSRIFGVAV
ncbi:IS6 family transposase [cyanobacterium TDX16]|nr:IS6 family transposase [cyanobacterium TDX16]